MPPCWLCKYASNEVALKATFLIVENVHAMDIDVMAQQISEIIALEARARFGDNVPLEGHDVESVRQHITQHMLHAPVALACTLRNLTGLAEQLRQQVYTVDEETGLRVLDAAQVKNYLAMVNQITTIYKLGDANRLLFMKGKDAKGDGGQS